MKAIFRDNGQTLASFDHTFLVHCPQCNECATVVPLDNTRRSYLDARRLVCTFCGYTRDWHEKSISIGEAVDCYFHLPLWLQVPCCGKTLWAYNAEHLSVLEEYVSAELRIKFTGNYRGALRNKTMASRLPSWMKSAKNRDAVLQGISKLRKKLL